MNENQFERVKRALKDMVNETIDGYFSEVQAGLAAHAAIAAMEWGWQPIETAPKDGTHVWVSWPNTIQGEAWYLDGFWHEHEYRDDVAPTHWRPLPAPPMTP